MSHQKLLYSFIVICICCSFGTSTKNTPDSKTQEFNIGNFKVILKFAYNQVISTQLFIKGGTANYTKQEEGIEALALDVATDGGTENYDKDSYHSILERMGSTISYESSFDKSRIALTCIKSNWDRSWELFTDVILNPRFDESPFINAKERLILNAKDGEADPDAFLKQLSMQDLFNDRNYSKLPNGSHESLINLELNQVRKYYKSLLAQNNMFLVVVGDIKKNDLLTKVKALLDQLPKQTKIASSKNNLTQLEINKSTINYEEREIATNYIRGMMSAPSLGTKEATAMRIAMSILGNRYFVEIRTKRNLSYAPQAYMARLKIPYSVIYVTTTDPNTAVGVMIDEIKKIKKEGFTDKELKDKKGNYLTQYYMQMETNSSQAYNLGQNEVLSKWQDLDNFVKEVNELALKDINAAFDKYAKGIKWTYLGKKENIDVSIFLQKLE